MSLVTTWPYTLTNGQTADANQVMANFNALSNASYQYVQTAASLRTTAAVSNNQIVHLTGYWTANDGIGEGDFAWYPASVLADDGGIVFQVTGVSTGRWIRQFIGPPFVNMWGADPTGVNASDTAFANAIAYCKANSIGTLMVGSGAGYTTAATITVNAPLKIIGMGYGNDNTNMYSATPYTMITATSGHAATPVFLFNSAVGGTSQTRDIGLIGVFVQGNYAGATPATMAVQASGTTYGEWDFSAYSFATCGMQHDCLGSSKNSAYHTIRNLFYSGGSTFPNTNGLHLYQQGTSAAVGCSENIVQNVVMLPPYGTGYAVVLGGDHNLIIQAVGAIRAINSGYNFGWDNTILNAGGTFVGDTGTYGNNILYTGSEAISVTLNGTAQAHYTTIDDVTSGRFYTPGYPMYDVLTLPVTSFMNFSAVVPANINATAFECWPLADANQISIICAAPYNWNNGNIIGVNIQWTADTANTGTVIFNLKPNSVAAGTTVATPTVQSTTIASTAYTVGEIVNTKITLGTPVAHTLGNILQLVVGRSTDTYTGKVGIISVQIVFQASGPYSSGHGTYNYGGMGT